MFLGQNMAAVLFLAIYRDTVPLNVLANCNMAEVMSIESSFFLVYWFVHSIIVFTFYSSSVSSLPGNPGYTPIYKDLQLE